VRHDRGGERHEAEHVGVVRKIRSDVSGVHERGNCVVSGTYPTVRPWSKRSETEVGTAIDPTKKLGKIVNSILITTSCYASGCVAFGRYIKSQTSTKDEHFTVSYATGRWRRQFLCRSTWGPRKPSKSSRSLAVTDATAWSSDPPVLQ